MRNKRSGFTLLELIIVVIVIGILASVALPRYITIAEKGRAAEAKALLSALRGAQIRYAAQYGVYDTSANYDNLDVDLQVPRYFTYNTTGVTTDITSDSGIVAAMTRNSVQRGNVPVYTMNISANGTLASSNASLL